jgi:hypothetical protein
VGRTRSGFLGRTARVLGSFFGSVDASTFVPSEWESDVRTDEEVFASAGRACERCYAAARRLAERRRSGLRRLPAVAALCAVSAERLDGGDPPELVLRACARLLEDAADDFGARKDDPESVALAVACRATTWELRRVLARLDPLRASTPLRHY